MLFVGDEDFTKEFSKHCLLAIHAACRVLATPQPEVLLLRLVVDPMLELKPDRCIQMKQGYPWGMTADVGCQVGLDVQNYR